MSILIMRAVLAATVAGLCLPCAAKLPPPSEEAKAQAAEASAKAAWIDKVGLYKTCVAMDRVATVYRDGLKREGKTSPPQTPTPACNDPGPYTPITAMTSKPIETSEAHSPPGTAVSPPSTSMTEGAAQGAKQ